MLAIAIFIPVMMVISQKEKAVIMNYCAQHSRNTPCMFDCLRSSRCGNTNTQYQDLPDGIRGYIVWAHWEVRSQVATGVLLIPPLRPYFSPVSYDKECEFIAGCYAKQCRNHRDKIRIALDGTRLGQNRYVLSMKKGAHHHNVTYNFVRDVFNSAFNSWYGLGAHLPKKHIPEIHDAYSPIIYPHRAAHFTQMVWEKTVYVGCAFMHSDRDLKWDMYEIICNYRPSGNIRGEKVYTLDNSNNCEPTILDTSMGLFNLCGKYRPFLEDTFVPPIDLNNAPIAMYRRNMVFIPIVIACALTYILHY